jgi:hypothetical protein
MTSIRPSKTSVMLVVNVKLQKRFSIKGRNTEEHRYLSRGYPAHKLFRQTGLNYEREAAVITTICLN